MLVSFVIPHKGREEMLKATVASIVGQDYDLKELEIIIVTQNNTLATDLCRETQLVSINTVFRPESETISALRNKGVEHSRGSYLAFLDADIAVSPNWVKAMLLELENKRSRVLVSAVQRCENNATPLEQIRTAISNATIDSEVNFLPGRNLFLRKETFSRAGGFPEHLVTCEDYYFTDQVHALGELYYSSKANYVHLGEDKRYRDLFRKEIWRGQSNFQSMKNRSIPLSEWPSLLVPLWVLVFSVCTIIACILMSPGYAVGCFGLFLLPVVLYSIRLYKIAGRKINFSRIMQFYLVYFTARIIGAISGLFREAKVRVV